MIPTDSTDVDRKLRAAITTFTTLIGSHYSSFPQWFIAFYQELFTHDCIRLIVKVPHLVMLMRLENKRRARVTSREISNFRRGCWHREAFSSLTWSIWNQENFSEHEAEMKKKIHPIRPNRASVREKKKIVYKPTSTFSWAGLWIQC